MLRPKKHITRQKIKEDQFITRTIQTADWARKNRRSLIYGSVAVVVAAVLLAGLISARREAEREASLLLLQAGYELNAGNAMGAMARLDEAVTRFGSTPSGGRAVFMMAQMLFQEGAVDSARTLYDRYLDDHADGGLLEAAARAGLAACMEASGDYLGAAEAYLRTAERDEEQPQAPHYMMQAGRCFRLAGDLRRAAEIYEQVARDYPNSAEGDRARVERAILARQEGVPE